MPLKSESVSCSVVSDSFRSHGLQPAQTLYPWDSPGKSTGVGCHCLLQGIFLAQGSNLGVLHCRQILYCLYHQQYPPGVLLISTSWQCRGRKAKEFKQKSRNLDKQMKTSPNFCKGSIRPIDSHTNVDPEAPENIIMVNLTFFFFNLGQSASNIRRMLQTLDNAFGMNHSQLGDVAFKVFNREQQWKKHDAKPVLDSGIGIP